MALASKLDRRELLRWSAGSLLSAGLWPGARAADETPQTGSFHFVAVNDTHYVDHGCGKWLEKVIRQIKQHPEKIEFCLLVGDLANDGRADQLAPVRDIFARLGVPTHVVVGNHDYRTQEDRKAFEELFPDRINYRFDHRGWQFVALDTTEGLRATNTNIPQSTFRWLDGNLPKLEKSKPTILFTHFPMGPLVPGRPRNASALLARFKEYNLQAVLNGHFHALSERKVNGVTITTDRCCSLRRSNHDSSIEKGYFLCATRDGKIEHRFVEVKPG
jgi:predicted phosphodiesterase